jgi:hypothetical protein
MEIGSSMSKSHMLLERFSVKYHELKNRTSSRWSLSVFSAYDGTKTKRYKSGHSFDGIRKINFYKDREQGQTSHGISLKIIQSNLSSLNLLKRYYQSRSTYYCSP